VTRARGQRGAAIVEFVWLALLLLVPLLYVVLAVFDTQRVAFAASVAARSASRAFVTAPDQGSGYARARLAARLAFTDQGVEHPHLTLVISCRPTPGECLTPGSVVSATVRSAADLPLLPHALGRNTPRISVDAVHRSPYGRFREARP
jgi:Flp pilus assembly protein TadG